MENYLKPPIASAEQRKFERITRVGDRSKSIQKAVSGARDAQMGGGSDLSIAKAGGDLARPDTTVTGPTINSRTRTCHGGCRSSRKVRSYRRRRMVRRMRQNCTSGGDDDDGDGLLTTLP